MKILFLIFVVLLSGCENEYQAKDIKSLLDNYCLRNDGIHVIKLYGVSDNLTSVTCNDGAYYKFVYLDGKK